MKQLLGLAALLALMVHGNELSAQNSAAPDPGSTQTEQARWIAPVCADELDDETQAKIDKIDEKSSFFNHTAFDCDEDWLSAEVGDAQVLRSIGQLSYRGNKPSKKAQTWKLRRIGRGGSATSVVAIECSFGLDEFGLLDEPIGGKVTRYIDNPYIHERANLRELRLGRSDCALFKKMLDNVEPESIAYGSMSDGPIIVDGGVFLVELDQGDGFPTIFSAYSGQVFDPNSRDAGEASEAIDLLFEYFGGRTKESGRRVAD